MGCEQSSEQSDDDRRRHKSKDPHRSRPPDKRSPPQRRHNDIGPSPGKSAHRRGHNPADLSPERNDNSAHRRRHNPADSPAERNDNSAHRGRHDAAEPAPEKTFDEDDAFINEDRPIDKILKGIPFETIISKCLQPPKVKDMAEVHDKNAIFMIKPWRYDPSRPNDEPKPNNYGNPYMDTWTQDNVLMPCSQYYVSANRQPMWNSIHQCLIHLKQKCDTQTATFEDLKETIEKCNGHQYDMRCLEKLINKTYSDAERGHFLSTTLSKMCDLVLTINMVFSEPPPLLRIGSNRSVTMSQRQAASLLACAFFCLFPYRSDPGRGKGYENFQNPNFERLYQGGNPQKIEKLKCIFQYFRRVTENMPVGVITFRRFALPKDLVPSWKKSDKKICDLHLTTGKKIEDVDHALQVDFANKFIGGGVLGSGCVQEEIRFTICPEMLVSLIVCEVMEPNECIFLIGCERFTSYKGYAHSFEYAGNYEDKTLKDSWGQKWCHLVAMDAIFFRDRNKQFEMESVHRELDKAYTSFRPIGPDREFAIVTGNWGCGAFNGDRHLKGIIQLMAASEAERPLIYAAYGDKKLVNSFAQIYDYLKKEEATVGDLYYYLRRYCEKPDQCKLFDFILQTPVADIRARH